MSDKYDIDRIMIHEVLFLLLEENLKNPSVFLQIALEARHTLNNDEMVDFMKRYNLWPAIELNGKFFDLTKVMK